MVRQIVKGVNSVVFSNLVFLYVFLPIVLLSYFLVPRFFKNTMLLIASLFFYAWGEPTYVFLMLFSVLMNYLFGLAVSKSENQSLRKMWIWFAVIVNFGILGYFKYANFFIDSVNVWFHTSYALDKIPLPIGISFFTFHAMSYVMDIYRKKVPVQKNLLDLALYIALFPQLVAGPIIRYNSVAEQLKKRFVTVDLFVAGTQRFILGLAKKVLIANPLGAVADEIFAISAGDLTTGTAWLGILAYTLQIYFDFSGYSDMAIGLGKMFGFHFDENFRYPYISRSISEFWRRWHISLGNWFRDYVYIPLGGNRVATWKIYRNLLIVWTATGFWHGASWTFMAWGFYYGIIIALEKAFLGNWLTKLWSPLQHIYVMLLVMIGWVFFRADNFAYSIAYIKTMFGFNGELYNNESTLVLLDNGWILLLAILLSMPLFPYLQEKTAEWSEKYNGFRWGREFFGSMYYVGLLLVVTMYLVNSTYNPFIYFRF